MNTLHVTVLQDVYYADAPTGTITLTGAITEAKSYTDTATGTLTESGTETDQRVYPDTPSGLVALSGVVAEADVDTDTPIGTVTLSGSLVDLYAPPVIYTDTPTGQLDLSGTSLAARAYADAPVGTIGGSTVEYVYVPVGGGGQRIQEPIIQRQRVTIREYNDTPIGVLTLTGAVRDAHNAPPLRRPARPPLPVPLEAELLPVTQRVTVTETVSIRKRETSPVGVLVLAGVLADSYDSPPVVVESEPDLQIIEGLFELLGA